MGDLVGVDLGEEVGGGGHKAEAAQFFDGLTEEVVVLEDAAEGCGDEEEGQGGDEAAPKTGAEHAAGEAVADGEDEGEEKEAEQGRVDGEEFALLGVDGYEVPTGDGDRDGRGHDGRDAHVAFEEVGEELDAQRARRARLGCGCHWMGSSTSAPGCRPTTTVTVSELSTAVGVFFCARMA